MYGTQIDSFRRRSDAAYRRPAVRAPQRPPIKPIVNTTPAITKPLATPKPLPSVSKTPSPTAPKPLPKTPTKKPVNSSLPTKRRSSLPPPSVQPKAPPTPIAQQSNDTQPVPTLKKGMSLRRNLTRKTTKRSKKSIALALTVLALVIAVIIYAVIFKFDFSASYTDQNLPTYEPPFSVAKITEHPAGASNPRVIDIPAINLRAPIVAQESSGTSPLIVPSTSNVVAWDKTSANLDSTPGVTTLVGHTKASGGTGVFNELYKLQVGNRIYVERGTGARDRYVVRRLETIPWQSLSRSTLLNPEDPSRHGLVIAGVVGSNGQASNVLVFYAVKQ